MLFFFDNDNDNKGPVIMYVEGGREEKKGGQGYFRFARGRG